MLTRFSLMFDPVLYPAAPRRGGLRALHLPVRQEPVNGVASGLQSIRLGSF